MGENDGPLLPGRARGGRGLRLSSPASSGLAVPWPTRPPATLLCSAGVKPVPLSPRKRPSRAQGAKSPAAEPVQCFFVRCRAPLPSPHCQLTWSSRHTAGTEPRPGHLPTGRWPPRQGTGRRRLPVACLPAWDTSKNSTKYGVGARGAPVAQCQPGRKVSHTGPRAAEGCSGERPGRCGRRPGQGCQVRDVPGFLWRPGAAPAPTVPTGLAWEPGLWRPPSFPRPEPHLQPRFPGVTGTSKGRSVA